MQKKKPNESHSALSPNCKIIAITWKDERWSASKKELKSINDMLRKNGELKKVSLFQKIINMIFSRKM